MRSIQFTRAGYAEVQKKLDDLLSKRPHAVSELQRSREMGDLSENGFYKAARHELSTLDSRIRHQKILLKFGEVVETSFNGAVSIGTRVKLKDGEITRSFLIVGREESNIKEEKLSHLSPLGRSLMGKRAGEKILFNSPKGLKEYQLIEVSAA
jgi:transcription elongation factor GreA